MADEEEGLDEQYPKDSLEFTASVLREILPKSDLSPDDQDPKSSILDQSGPWIAVHGSKSAVIVEDQTQVQLVCIGDEEQGSAEPANTIQAQNKVLAMAFSACGEFLAVADSTGTLSLYKSDGELLFGHRVVRTDSSDSVVCIRFASEQESVSPSDSQDLVVVTSAGLLLRLGDLRLAEFEQLLHDRPKDALRIILRNIRFERTNVGHLKESALSCMLVSGRKERIHRVETEEFLILGNHGVFLSVWKTSSQNKEGRADIQKVSACDSRTTNIDIMAFDGNYSLLVLLSEGKLSWWNWREMTELFEADVTGVTSFAILTPCGHQERDSEVSSLLAAARSPDGESSAPSLEIIRVVHPTSGKIGAAHVVSRLEAAELPKWTNVALFPRTRSANQPEAVAACRTPCGVSLLLLTSDVGSSMDEADESLDSDSHEIRFDEDAATLAESLVDVPISSLLTKRSMKVYRAKLDRCTKDIGESDDASRTMLQQLLRVASNIREYTSSSPRSSSLLASLLKWCDEISELSYKWTTFQLLRSSSTTEAASGRSLREQWDLFRTEPVLALLGRYVKLGSMRAVTILWNRHVDGNTTRNIGKLLRFLPASLPVSAYAGWIQGEVVPTLINYVAEPPTAKADTASEAGMEADSRSLLTELALWLLERSEATAAKGDLDTAIRICNLLNAEDGQDGMNVGDFSFYELKLQTSATYSSSKPQDDSGQDEEKPPERDAFKRLEHLSEKLRHVKHLAAEHQFVISLSVFEGETPATIAMSMLDRVFATESLTEEVEQHVKKYLQFCDADVDPVLHDYIAELAESIQTSRSAEESRALVLLDEIADLNIRADATLALLRSALPPYSPALKSYANNCARSWKTERQAEIEEHVRLMEIQDMLTAYDIKQFDIADAKSASRLVSHILNQVSKPTAFKDAMLLVDAYSDLHCDRAAVTFTENLLSDSDVMLSKSERLKEVEERVTKATDALAEVKERKEPKSHLMMYVTILEEVIEFGVTLLAMEAEETEEAQRDENADGGEPQSFLVCMLKALVAEYLAELKALVDLGDATRSDSVRTYTESQDYLLSDGLLSDLQRISQVEAGYGVLLSLSTLRDPEQCELKLKQLIKPEILFTEGSTDADLSDGNAPAAPVSYVGKGKGKKRAAVSNDSNRSLKRPRTQLLGDVPATLQQDDERTRLLFDLNRFASAVGIESKVCQFLIAQSAARNGSILQAMRFSRDLFSRRANTDINLSSPPTNKPESDLTRKFHPADALKRIARSLSLYTSNNVKAIYDIPVTRSQQLLPAQVARIQAPVYTLELLKYALCMCDKESFDEILVLLKNTMLVNEILQFTQHHILPTRDHAASWRLYPRWYRGDACALPSYEAMKLATRFAVAEHKNFRQRGEPKDTIASKRYVSFLVEQCADLLSLQALMSMQALPEDAASVVNTQMGKLLSTIFQSQEIDNYLALGLMLAMKQEDAFHAFRRQISRENVAKDFNRFQQLAFIGADAARAWQQIGFLHQCVELEGNARWWHYLNLLGIECDHKAFQSGRRDLQYIHRLVPTLITRSNYDFYTVLEFTRHYQIDDGFPSLVYAEALLLEESASVNLEYQDKIAGVIEDIHEQHLVKLLLKSIPKVSGQDYDRLLFVFRLLLENTSYRERGEVERRMEVLRNLKAFAAFQAKGNLARDGKELEEKISFHALIANPREVLAKVVTKENFNGLIGLADPLGLEPDELQMLLLKNMITTNSQQDALGDSNSVAHFSAFDNILGCLSDVESRVTAAEWLAENFPLGEDKLKALEFALNAAVLGGKSGDDPSNASFTGHEALARLETKILRVKVELLLRNASSQTSSLLEVINDKKQTSQLLAMVSEPKKLFLELYRRYALWFYTHSNDMLHAVANSIGELLQLQQEKLRLELVREWLVQDAVHVDNGSSGEEPKENPFDLVALEKLDRADEDYAKRILYLTSASVKRGDAFGDQVLKFLVDFAKDSRPLAGVTYRAKVRALRVILRLGQLHHGAVDQYVTTKYGIQSSDPFFKELLGYTKHCTHMVAFEEHRVPYDMAFVLKCDKEVLTRSLLRRFSGDRPWVLRCASQLMLDFEVIAADLWEDVLANMLRLGMVRSLATIMLPLCRKAFVRSLDCGRQVWEEVLTLPLIHLKHNGRQSISAGPEKTTGSADASRFAGIPVSSIRPVLERMVTLLQRCPFLDQMDVPAFVIHLRDLTALAEEEPEGAEIVKQLDLYGFAVKCAMVIPRPVARFEALMRIIHAGAFGSVLNELLETSCFLDAEPSEQALEDNEEIADNVRLVQESFCEAAKREDYSAIQGTPFEPGFMEYLAATANIDYLLSLLLEGERMEAALNAVELFYECHPSEAPKKPDDGDADRSGSKRWELIDAYLASSSSPHLERFRAS